MRLGVSNLLWTPDMDGPVAELLARRQVNAVDLAPSRYFRDLAATTTAEVMDQAAEFFGEAAGDAGRLGVCLTVEPVSARYGNSHVQIAEYQLAPLCAGNPLHAAAGPILAAGLPGRVACIEALKPPDISSIEAIAQSLDVAQAHYG